MVGQSHRRLALHVVAVRVAAAWPPPATSPEPYVAFAWRERAQLPRAMSTLARRVVGLGLAAGTA